MSIFPENLNKDGQSPKCAGRVNGGGNGHDIFAWMRHG